MTNEKRALSWQEFLDSGFDGRDYNFPDFEGTFEAEVVCKRWDKNSKLLVYLNFDDGRKIITSAWQDSNYKGLADIPFHGISGIVLTSNESVRTDSACLGQCP